MSTGNDSGKPSLADFRAKMPGEKPAYHRRHSALDYESPANYEKKYRAAA
ncbi:hypothetical protein ACN6A1_11415 [Myxococcus virescens]